MGWIMIQTCRIVGNFSYFITGVMSMYLNQCWTLNPNLAWTVSWLNGLGGFVFFVAGLLSVVPGHEVQSIYFPLGYLIGSSLYLGGSIGALMMWRKSQSRFDYDLSMSRGQDQNYRSKSGEKKWTDIMCCSLPPMVLFLITATLVVIAISLSTQSGSINDDRTWDSVWKRPLFKLMKFTI